MSAPKLSQLSPEQKVGILLLAFGEEIASEILKHLERNQVVRISQAIHKLGKIDNEIANAVICEFQKSLREQTTSIKGGHEAVTNLLRKAFKNESNSNIIAEFDQQKPRFEILNTMDPSAIANIISNEHIQIITVVLTYLNPDKCAKTLKLLPSHIQTEIIIRMAKLTDISPEMLDIAEEMFLEKSKSLSNYQGTKKGGIQAVAKMLAEIDLKTRERLLEDIQQKDTDLANQIAERLFLFSDIAKLPDQSVQELLKRIPGAEWQIALKSASEEVKQKIFTNLSSRAAKLLQDDMINGPKHRMSEVEKIQKKIAKTVADLTKEGIIMIGDDYV